MKKLLLDECVPRKFRNYLPEYECVTVPEAGFAGKKNGELLLLAENAGFEVFLTLESWPGMRAEPDSTTYCRDSGPRTI